MGKFNEMSVIQSNNQQLEFVPSSVYLGGQPASLVWRTRLGPVEIVQSGYEDETKSVLVVVLSNGDRYRCKVETFGGRKFPFYLIDALALVTGSGTRVELCVAVSNRINSQAAPGFFCGLRIAGSKTDRGLISL